MDYTQFCRLAEMRGASYIDLHAGRYASAYSADHHKDKLIFAFYATWRTGGESGGSCYDTGDEDRHYSIEPDEEPALDDLKAFLLDIDPDLSLRIYTEIEQKIDTDTHWRSFNEYYGNYTVTGLKYILVDDIYAILKEKGKCE